jgi:hypothetical protein
MRDMIIYSLSESCRQNVRALHPYCKSIKSITTAFWTSNGVDHEACMRANWSKNFLGACNDILAEYRRLHVAVIRPKYKITVENVSTYTLLTEQNGNFDITNSRGGECFTTLRYVVCSSFLGPEHPHAVLHRSQSFATLLHYRHVTKHPLRR